MSKHSTVTEITSQASLEPNKSAGREQRITILLSAAEKQTIIELARKTGLSTSAFIRREALSGNQQGALGEAIRKLAESTATITASIESHGSAKGAKE